MEYENTFVILFTILFFLVLILFAQFMISQEKEKELECMYWQLEKEYMEKSSDLTWYPSLKQIEQCLPFNIQLR